MKTRQDYLDGKCTHQEYYAQFVDQHTKNVVSGSIDMDKLKNAVINGDLHLNSVPLREWDMLTQLINPNMDGGTSLAGKVCVLKEAARQLLNT